MLQYLVGARIAAANELAATRGWTALGFGRFATLEGNEVRFARRLTDLSPMRGTVPFIKSGDFSENAEAQAFEQIVKQGAAKWIKQ
jgi:hypothetical protein